MSPGDRPGLPLTAEPATVLRAAAIGRPTPGAVQPVEHELGLGEEPALRFEAIGRVRASGRGDTTPRRPPASPDTRPVAPERALPTTGAQLPVITALGSMGLAWVLRRRSS